MRLPVAVLLAVVLLAGCASKGGNGGGEMVCDAYGGTCAVPPALSSTAPPSTSASSSSGAGPSYASSTSGCMSASPCPIPPMDGHPDLALLANASYARGSVAHLRLRNDGTVNYTYGWTQASCWLGIYDEWGRRLDEGNCSDWYESARLAPGQEADYWSWGLSECRGEGPWYGGCNATQAEPPGLYHLRQTFCTEPNGGQSPTGGPGQRCSRSGADLRIT